MNRKRPARASEARKRKRVTPKVDDEAETEPTNDSESKGLSEKESNEIPPTISVAELTSARIMTLSLDELREIGQNEPDLQVEPKTYNPPIDGKGPSLEGDWRLQITEEEAFNKSEKSILIASWNVNGLRALLKSSKLGTDENPMGDLGRYLDLEKPDIICLNETKLNEKIHETIDQEYFNDRYIVHHAISKKAGYAGVAILISKESNLSEFVEEVIIGCEHPTLDQEGRTVAIIFTGLILVATYVLNSGQSLDRLPMRITQFDEHLQNWLFTAHKNRRRPIIWCGDLNCARATIDIWNSKANAKSSGHTWQERLSFTKFLMKTNFKDLWRLKNPTRRRYTFWPARAPQQREANLGWRLDSFIGSEEVQRITEFIAIRDKVLGSDHCPIVMALPKSTISGEIREV